MKKWIIIAVFTTVILTVALFLRFIDSDRRPMHADEAVQAFIFRDLLENGEYIYDPHEYHGPTLHYLTLLTTSNADNLNEVTDVQLRAIPAVFGVLTVAFILLLLDGLGKTGTISAMALAAVSSGMVFFSRYYIHEMLLVCFTALAIGAGWRCFMARRTATRIAWAYLAGSGMGLMHASKETCIITFFAAFVAGVAILICRKLEKPPVDDDPRPGLRGAGSISIVVAVALLAAVGSSMLLFSSFGNNPGGISDSVTTYASYLNRGEGETVTGNWHVNPWYFYLKTLIVREGGSFPVSGEGLIVLMAIIGSISSIRRKWSGTIPADLARFLSVFTLTMLLVYSVIPYKTPWCVLSTLLGMILLSGIGVAAILRLCGKSMVTKVAAAAILLTALALVVWQSEDDNFRTFEDPANPYVYVHTTSGFLELLEEIEEIATLLPDGHNTITIQVISPEGIWPLPWYMRHYSRVGYMFSVPEGQIADIIIYPPHMDGEVGQAIGKMMATAAPGEASLYMPMYNSGQFRPGVYLQGSIKYDLQYDAAKAKVKARQRKLIKP